MKIITINEYPNAEEVVLEECEGAMCLGISVISGFPLKVARRVSEKVKEKYPKLPIVWGGWLATTLPEEALKLPFVDYICMGQGERFFGRLIDVLSRNRLEELKDIPRLGYKKNGELILSQREGTDSLDDLPEYNLDLVNWEKYLEITDFGKRVLRITTSYGCPHRCAFCCEPLSSKRMWKGETAEQILDRVKELRKRVDIDGLMIVDSNFFVSEKRAVDFFQGLLDNDIHIKVGQVNGRTNVMVRFAPSTWELMEKAGLYNILVGAESGSEQTLSFVNKDATVEDTYKLVKLCDKYHVQMGASIIVGLPTDDYAKDPEKAFQADLESVIDLYNGISEGGFKHHLIVFAFGPLPFSPLWERSIEIGFKPPKDIDGWSTYALRDADVPWIPKKAYQKVVLLNYVSMVLSMDLTFLLASIPSFFSIPVKPTLALFKKIASWRFHKKYLEFPLDMWIFYGIMYSFKKINQVFKMVNITG
ncbi:hypothetical protein A2415_02945 [candidate division WWE3 bacterium RIFOXYC1_FULL_39_7]|uniref:Uncharacterized protein n=2 Tax=Katanobacteria TaxID=422282 RepID=A0A1F4X8Y8_UNCKA|nr:MAG: hypothetical protein A2415_02945 [candidate division WWE3 bacterium RIFOXYC1_FULL_39_7]OGC77991.1 MAG: hypothetical protein A2619_02790 [candidate division WWE3 bacterium RIFOXYD1_FULL_39_9]